MSLDHFRGPQASWSLWAPNTLNLALRVVQYWYHLTAYTDKLTNGQTYQGMTMTSHIWPMGYDSQY
jgi:hypothetical protein